MERLENELTEDAKRIKALEDDLREVLNLMRLIGALMQSTASGMAEEKAAIEFETQLKAALQKHGLERDEQLRPEGEVQ
jgi:hypothetical protein